MKILTLNNNTYLIYNIAIQYKIIIENTICNINEKKSIKP